MRVHICVHPVLADLELLRLKQEPEEKALRTSIRLVIVSSSDVALGGDFFWSFVVNAFLILTVKLSFFRDHPVQVAATPLSGYVTGLDIFLLRS